MTIQYVMLGFLSWRPFSGYELKKLIADSPFFHWSGNNNQIYTTLVQLHREGLVSYEIEHQEKNPSRKIYSITPEGLDRLKTWLLSNPDPPQFRNPFLTQLAWADLLDNTGLESLLEQYEQEVRLQWLMGKEQTKRGIFSPARSPRQMLLWGMMNENRLAFYKSELDWIRKLRAKLQETKRLSLTIQKRKGEKI